MGIEKDFLEQLARQYAFEHDPAAWNEANHTPTRNGKPGDIVVYSRGGHLYSAVIALWSTTQAVVFYTTPDDVENEKKNGWIPPIFRAEVSVSHLWAVPRKLTPRDYSRGADEALERAGRLLRAREMRGDPIPVDPGIPPSPRPRPRARR